MQKEQSCLVVLPVNQSSSAAVHAEQSARHTNAAVASPVQTKMARVIATLRIMPDGTDADLSQIEAEAKRIITEFNGTIMTVEKKPIGFGIVSVEVKFNMDENKGSTEPIEDAIRKVSGVESVEIIAISRAFG